MATSLPDSYRRLTQYAVRFPAGDVVYEQGTVPGHCYLVLRGEVVFEVLDTDGELAVVASAHEGHLVGHVAAFTGRSTSATARAKGEVILLAVPLPELVSAFREAPELALTLIRAFADPQELAPAPWLAAPVEEQPVEEQPAEATEPPAQPAPAQPPLPAIPAVPIDGEFENKFFFVDTAECPVSRTRFDYLRVRTSAVRPISRDSDFYIRYSSLDPTYYSIVVCPSCGYAAYREDFADLTEDERAALRGATDERTALMSHRYSGVRSTDDAQHVARLALACYALRRPNERRRAALLHRLAWIERERGNSDEEERLLLQARDAYRAAFERDANISDEGAMRAAYLIGDLTLRLGDAVQAARWFETATRSPEAKNQSGLERLARERLYDAHLMLTGSRAKRSA